MSHGERTPPPAPPSSRPQAADAVVNGLLERLRVEDGLESAELRTLWQMLSSTDRPPEEVRLYAALAEQILRIGEPVLAYDVVRRGLQFAPSSARLRQLSARALARSGALERANQSLRTLHRERRRDGETLGLLAQTHKELHARASSAQEAAQHLRAAHRYYALGFRNACKAGELDSAVYAGVNAASTALLAGRHRRARSLAREVQRYCRSRLEAGEDYWATATLGEAALVLGDLPEAERWYTRAGSLGRGRHADLASTRRQARALLRHLGEDASRCDTCLPVPKVLVFTGHRFDEPRRARPRLPRALEETIRQEIAARLEKHSPKIGYSSLAYGSDMLFAEEMLRQKAEIHVVLPCSPAAFRKLSLELGAGRGWASRFTRILRHASSVTVANDRRTSCADVHYDYANRIQTGLATLRARVLSTELVPMAVWNGRKGDGFGGTASVVAHWRSRGLEPEIIDPSRLSPARRVRATPRTRRASRTAPRTASAVREPAQILLTMLFADVHGFSKLTEEAIPRFTQHFMGAVARVLRAARGSGPLYKETWGDALYLVFRSLEEAGSLALDLQDAIKGVDWLGQGLPRDMAFRVALHTGPAYPVRNPVLGVTSYTGAHVIRTARMEPITPAGEVYASEAFAALAAAEGVTGFRCDYVGKTPLAKNFGSLSTYHLRRLGVEERRGAGTRS